MIKNPQIDLFLNEGCGRCAKWRTPECKVQLWPEELKALRNILLRSDLKEEVKWSQPCYTYQNKNVILLFALKDYCGLSFFKGTLLKDPQQLLRAPGPNTQAARQLQFTQIKEIQAQESLIQHYIQEAIAIETAGLNLEPPKQVGIPEELSAQFLAHPELKQAFEALTPGRQRGYLIYFSGAKQAKTRSSRILKYSPKILAGKGFHDR